MASPVLSHGMTQLIHSLFFPVCVFVCVVAIPYQQRGWRRKLGRRELPNAPIAGSLPHQMSVQQAVHLCSVSAES